MIRTEGLRAQKPCHILKEKTRRHLKTARMFPWHIQISQQTGNVRLIVGKQKGLYQSLPRKDEKEMYFQAGGYIYLFMDLYHWPTLIVRFFVIYKDHTCTSIVLLNIAPLNILSNNMTNNTENYYNSPTRNSAQRLGGETGLNQPHS